MALKEQGLGVIRIAHILGATPQSVCRWLRAYRRSGPTGLAPRPTPGRPCRLSPRQKRGLVACLLRGARAFGFATDLWTCPRIAQLIRERWGVSYHVDHVPRLMAGLGFSPSEARASRRRA